MRHLGRDRSSTEHTPGCKRVQQCSRTGVMERTFVRSARPTGWRKRVHPGRGTSLRSATALQYSSCLTKRHEPEKEHELHKTKFGFTISCASSGAAASPIGGTREGRAAFQGLRLRTTHRPADGHDQ